MFNIYQLLDTAVKRNATDVHLSSGQVPHLRIQGMLRKEDMPEITEDELIENMHVVTSEHHWKSFMQQSEVDFSISVEKLARFRVNIYRHQNGIAAAFRMIPFRIRSLEELLMPPAVISLAEKRKGLILFTGPTGSGKSTTVAALIDKINREQRRHILTIEDPIEYLFQSQRSLIHQREIGAHTNTFSNALRHGLREDPDVIFIGEMRDIETISLALKAAETGHLVLSTLHTNNSSETVDRVVDVFPSEQQKQIRIMLSNTILAVIGQRLVPRKNSNDRVAVVEYMHGNTAIKNMIRDGKSHQIISVLQTGAKYGMQTFDKSLKMLIEQDYVEPIEIDKVY